MAFCASGRRGKFHECEAAGFARNLVQHQVHGRDRARLGEVILKIVFPRLEREVAYKESVFVHNIDAQKTKWEVCTGSFTECRFLFRLTDNLSR